MCFGHCHLSVKSRWHDCNHSKQLVGCIWCVGQPFENKTCNLVLLNLSFFHIYITRWKKDRFHRSRWCKLHHQMDVELRGKGVLNSKLRSQEKNPDFYVPCNIQCRPGEYCQKLRAQCLKVYQGRAKVKVSRNDVKIETGPGKTGLQ